MKPFAIILFAAALSLAFHASETHESVVVKRPAKLFYDRIGAETELFRQPRCKTPGTVWWDGKCFRPERLPRT